MIQRLSMSEGNIRNMMFLQVNLGLQIQILTLTLPPHHNQMAVTTGRGRSIHKKAEGKAVKNHAAKSHTTGGPGHSHSHRHYHRKADLRGHVQNHHRLRQRHLLQLA